MKNKKTTWIFLFLVTGLILFSLGGCKKALVLIPPFVSTTDVTNIGLITATGGGNVTDSGGGTVTARGICWSATATPTTSDSKTTDGTGTGIFTSNLTGLTANTLYHVRAYAVTSAGTGYGVTVTFTTAH